MTAVGEVRRRVVVVFVVAERAMEEDGSETAVEDLDLHMGALVVRRTPTIGDREEEGRIQQLNLDPFSQRELRAAFLLLLFTLFACRRESDLPGEEEEEEEYGQRSQTSAKHGSFHSCKQNPY